MFTIAGGIILAIVFIIAGIALLSFLAHAIFWRWFWISGSYLLTAICALAGLNTAALFFGVIGTWIWLATTAPKRYSGELVTKDPSFKEHRAPEFTAPR